LHLIYDPDSIGRFALVDIGDDDMTVRQVGSSLSIRSLVDETSEEIRNNPQYADEMLDYIWESGSTEYHVEEDHGDEITLRIRSAVEGETATARASIDQ
jgi:hypothetical protein